MDRYRGITKVPIVDNRIGHLLQRIAEIRTRGGYRTMEELSRAYADVAAKFSKGQTEKVYDIPEIAPGDPLTSDFVNFFLLAIYSEVRYLLGAARDTGEVTRTNFNFTVSRIQHLQSLLKKCNDELSVYSLYTTKYGDAFYQGDSFNTLRKIDRGSDLIEAEPCTIDLAEGAITLPVKEESETWEISSVEIGALSNGVRGNNVEAGAPTRPKTSSLYDGNPDTWFEYERVVEREDPFGLRLDLKIILKDIKPVNNIRIHPVFLGARTPFVIQTIETSEDGREWISLKESVRVADFLDETAEDRFHLSPHSSKFEGEFRITFAPRFTKFVRVLLRQSSSFSIKDIEGRRRLRYAIAIKEIEINGQKYAASGEIVSKNLSLTKTSNYAGILGLVDPPIIPAGAGGANFFLSHNDGTSWTEVSDLRDAIVGVDEVLNLPEDTTHLRYKVQLWKDIEQFVKSINVPEVYARELHTRGPDVPLDISLRNEPIEDTLVVCDPEVAGRGKPYPKLVIGYGRASSLAVENAGGSWERQGETQLRLKIPLIDIVDPDDIILYVNNVSWTRVSSTGSFTTVYDKKYVLQKTGADAGSSEPDTYWEVIFGNDEAISPMGAIPGPGDEIAITLSEENVVPEGVSPPYKIKLDYAADGNKDNTQLYFTKDVTPCGPMQAPLGVDNFTLRHSDGTPVTDISVDDTGKPNITIFTPDLSDGFIEYSYPPNGTGFSSKVKPVFKDYVDFVDGRTELEADGDWTLDIRTGKIYSHRKVKKEVVGAQVTSPQIIWSIEKRVHLEPSDWDFIEGKLNEIKVYDTGYYTLPASATLSVGDLHIETSYPGIVTKSVRLPEDTFGSGYPPYEIPFVDGSTEFIQTGRIQSEDIPEVSFEDIGGGLGVAKFRLTHYENLLDMGFTFSNLDSDMSYLPGTRQYFLDGASEFAGATGSEEWSVDVSGIGPDGPGYIYLCSDSLSTVPSGETVSYQYEDLFSSERLKGAFSVNSREGVIHFASSVSSAGTAQYRYANYKARYNIAMQLEKDKQYKVDTKNKRITITTELGGVTNRKLAISYRHRENVKKVKELAPYFSPILRAIALRAT